MDALSEVLRLARFNAGITLDATARAPWCVTISANASIGRVHVVLEGECVLKSSAGGGGAPQSGGPPLPPPRGGAPPRRPPPPRPAPPPAPVELAARGGP